MVQISELSSLIHFKCDTSQAQSLYLHKETNAPYVVTSSLEYYAGSFYETGHNIAELTEQDLDEILHSVYELDIQTAIKTQYFTIHERLAWKSFEFKGKRYRFETYLHINGVKIRITDVVVMDDTVKIHKGLLPKEISDTGLLNDIYCYLPVDSFDMITEQIISEQ